MPKICNLKIFDSVLSENLICYEKERKQNIVPALPKQLPTKNIAGFCKLNQLMLTIKNITTLNDWIIFITQSYQVQFRKHDFQTDFGGKLEGYAAVKVLSWTLIEPFSKWNCLEQKSQNLHLQNSEYFCKNLVCHLNLPSKYLKVLKIVFMVK